MPSKRCRAACSTWSTSTRVGRHHRLQLVVPAPRRPRLRPDGQRPHNSGSVSTNNSAMWSSIARRSWPMAGRGPGGASASNSTWPTRGRRPTQLVDVGHSVQRAAAAIRPLSLGARIVLCPNEGNGAGLISSANTVNPGGRLQLGRARTRLLRPVAADLQPVAGRFAIRHHLDVRHDELLGGRRPRQGRKFGLGEWGVASGPVGRQPGRRQPVLHRLPDELAIRQSRCRRGDLVLRGAACLVSDITTPAHNPTARGPCISPRLPSTRG